MQGSWPRTIHYALRLRRRVVLWHFGSHREQSQKNPHTYGCTEPSGTEAWLTIMMSPPRKWEELLVERLDGDVYQVNKVLTAFTWIYSQQTRNNSESAECTTINLMKIKAHSSLLLFFFLSSPSLRCICMISDQAASPLKCYTVD